MMSMKFVAGLALAALAMTGMNAQAQDAEPQTKTGPNGEELIELKVRLPKPMFVGTPTNIKSENLEESTGKPRETFFVAKGANALLSRMKPVTSSDTYPIIGEASFVTDGDKNGGDGSFVELGPGMQWVQIDLDKELELSAVVLWHYHSQARVYRDVIVQASNDKEFKEGVTTLFNNDHDNSAGLGAGKDKEWIETNEGKLVDAKAVRARYVRAYSAGNTSNDQNHYVEIEVYGRQ